MATIASLSVSLTANIQKFQKKLTAATSNLRRFGSTVAGIGFRAAKFAAAGILGLGAAFTVLFVKTANGIDKLAKLEDRLGISTEAISRLSVAFADAGVPFQAGAVGLQRMTRRLAEAAQGTGEAQGAIKELGLDAQELSKLPVDKQFQAIAKSFQTVKGDADKVRLAFKLFDTEGVGFLQVFRGGDKAIRDATRAADAFGVTIKSKTAQKVADLVTLFGRLQFRVSGFIRQIVAKLAPHVLTLTERFSDWLDGIVDANGGIDTITTNVVKFIVETAESIVEWAGKFKNAFLGLVSDAGAFVKSLVPKLVLIGKILLSVFVIGVMLAVAALRTFFQVMAGNPIDNARERWAAFQEVIDRVKIGLQALQPIISQVLGVFEAGIGGVVVAVSGVFLLVTKFVGQILRNFAVMANGAQKIFEFIGLIDEGQKNLINLDALDASLSDAESKISKFLDSGMELTIDGSNRAAGSKAKVEDPQLKETNTLLKQVVKGVNTQQMAVAG